MSLCSMSLCSMSLCSMSLCSMSLRTLRGHLRELFRHIARVRGRRDVGVGDRPVEEVVAVLHADLAQLIAQRATKPVWPSISMVSGGRPISPDPAASRPIGLPRYQEKLTLGPNGSPTSQTHPTELRVTTGNAGIANAVRTSSSVTFPHSPKNGPGSATVGAAGVVAGAVASSAVLPPPQPARTSNGTRPATPAQRVFPPPTQRGPCHPPP